MLGGSLLLENEPLETLEEGVVRELFEETGLTVRVMKLLYICDKTDALPQILHITFMLERICGEIRLPTNEFDENPIHDVKMININELTKYGFSELFQDIVEKGFPNAGNYMGSKTAIGL